MDPGTLALISLGLTAAGTGVSAIQGADSAGAAQKEADKQASEEQKLIDKAKAQQDQENSNANKAATNAAAIAARRALAGQTQGFGGTILGGGSGAPAALGGNMFAQGKTLLG